MANTRRRVISILMALVLTLGLLPTAALAEGGASGSNEAWVVDKGGTKNSDDGLVTVSKTAEHKDGNNFEITLTVTVEDQVSTTPEQPVHVVLVMDESNSMDKDRMDAAKSAAREFVNIVLGKDAAEENKIAVVDFAEKATTVQNLSGDKQTVLNAISEIAKQYKGTNIQAGIHQAKQILDSDTSFQGKQVILVFSDGMPTYSYRATGTAQGTCEDYDWWDNHKTGSIISGTEEFESFYYSKIVGDGTNYYGYSESGWGGSQYINHVYGTAQVTCEKHSDVTWTDNYCEFFENHGDPTIEEAKNSGYDIYSIFLDGYTNQEKTDKANAVYTMQNIAVNDGEYSTTSDMDKLGELFKGVAEEITTSTDAGTVTDPMGDFIVLGDVSNLTGVTKTDDGLVWDLTKCEGIKNGTKTTYSVTYPVTLDTSAAGFESNKAYSTNGTTTFHYSVSGAQRSVDFKIPTVSGVKEYQVVYEWADGAEAPAGATLPETQTGLTSLGSVTVAGLPSATGYTIGGWYTNENGTGTPVAPGEGVDLSEYAQGNTVTLYATSELKGDLQVEKELTSVNGADYVDGASVKVGDELTYTITVTNTGYKTLTNISVSDTLDTNLEYKSSNPEGTVNGQEISWTIDSLSHTAPNNTWTATVTATVQASASGSSVTNSAKATDGKLTDETDPPVTTPVEEALEVTKGANQTTVTKGDKVVYTITVTNNTNVDLANVVVTDGLPTSLKYVSADQTPDEGKTDTWTIASLPCTAGSNTWTVKVTAEVDTNTAGDIKNTATASVTLDGETLTDTDDATVTVTSTGSLTLEKKFSYKGNSAETAAPDDFAATFTLTNQDTQVAYPGTYNGETKTVTWEKLPYGTYTLSETDVQGTMPGEQDGRTGAYNWVSNTIQIGGSTVTEIKIEAAATSGTLTNNYEFVYSDKVAVVYAWTDDSVTWPEGFGQDPIAGYNENKTTFEAEKVEDLNFLAKMPAAPDDIYSVVTDQWLIKEGDAFVPVTVDKLNAIQGGSTVTLYARMIQVDGDYTIDFEFWYRTNDTDNYDGPYTAVTSMAYTASLEEGATSKPNAKTVWTAAKTAGSSKTTAVKDTEGNEIPSAIYYFAESYSQNEVTVTGSLATGDLKYTIKLYATDYQTGGLEIRKEFTGLTDALIEALKETLTFTVTDEDGEIVAIVSFADFAYNAGNDFYYYRLADRLDKGTYTVTESGYDVADYTVNADTEKTVYVAGQATGYSTCTLTNAYTGTEYRVVFLAGDHGVMNIPNNSNHGEDDYTRYIWVQQGNDTLWTVNQNGSGAVQSNEAAHFDFDQSQLDGVDIAPIDALNAPGVTADNNWNFNSFRLVQDGRIRNTVYPASLAALMTMFDEYAVVEDGVLTLTFEATYSREDDGDDTPIVWPDPDPDPDPDTDTDIPDENTPTTDLPDEDTPTTDLPDEGTPTTDLPDEDTPTTDLPDEETPLADVPETGDSTGLWVLAAGVSGVALVWVALSGKKRREDNI